MRNFIIKHNSCVCENEKAGYDNKPVSVELDINEESLFGRKISVRIYQVKNFFLMGDQTVTFNETSVDEVCRLTIDDCQFWMPDVYCAYIYVDGKAAYQTRFELPESRWQSISAPLYAVQKESVDEVFANLLIQPWYQMLRHAGYNQEFHLRMLHIYQQVVPRQLTIEHWWTLNEIVDEEHRLTPFIVPSAVQFMNKFLLFLELEGGHLNEDQLRELSLLVYENQLFLPDHADVFEQRISPLMTGDEDLLQKVIAAYAGYVGYLGERVPDDDPC